MAETVLLSENAIKNDKPWRFKEGNPGKAVGTQNKLTRTVKETVLAVFNEIQDDPKVKLVQFAKDHPRDFYQIAARLIPTELTGAVTANFEVTLKLK